MLKAITGINQVLIVSDSSVYGSDSWDGLILAPQAVKNLHSFLVSSIGAIEYTPTVVDADSGTVALIEMTLLSRAKHLITVGKGSFQERLQAKFLERHRGHNQPQWSRITMCSQ